MAEGHASLASGPETPGFRPGSGSFVLELSWPLIRKYGIEISKRHYSYV
jgi:hypothetical protein